MTIRCVLNELMAVYLVVVVVGDDEQESQR